MYVLLTYSFGNAYHIAMNKVLRDLAKFQGFKPGAPGFLVLLLSANFSVCVCACACVRASAPEAINN